MNPSKLPRYFALIPAAGVGVRMAAQSPKQYLPIAGKSILQHCVTAFLQHNQIDHVFVVVNEHDAYVASELQEHPRLTVFFCGGDTRMESVMNGLMAMRPRANKADWVLVHDAARPGVNHTLISRLIDAVGQNETGGLLALPVADTVKLKAPGSKQIKTLSRADLWLAQTPQMFQFAALSDALAKANVNARELGIEITDEASAMEMAGTMPKLVEGHWCNSKITRPDDLALVEFYITNLAATELKEAKSRANEGVEKGVKAEVEAEVKAGVNAGVKH